MGRGPKMKELTDDMNVIRRLFPQTSTFIIGKLSSPRLLRAWFLTHIFYYIQSWDQRRLTDGFLVLGHPLVFGCVSTLDGKYVWGTGTAQPKDASENKILFSHLLVGLWGVLAPAVRHDDPIFFPILAQAWLSDESNFLFRFSCHAWSGLDTDLHKSYRWCWD